MVSDACWHSCLALYKVSFAAVGPAERWKGSNLAARVAIQINSYQEAHCNVLSGFRRSLIGMTDLSA